MAGRLANPNQGNRLVAGAAILLVAGWHANPATASSDTPTLCDDVADLALENPVHTFQATGVNYESDAKLEDDNVAAPVTSDKAVESREKKKRIAADDKVPAVNARVPGVSDDELARYKRRMYRKDI